jgi:hypothetical protein
MDSTISEKSILTNVKSDECTPCMPRRRFFSALNNSLRGIPANQKLEPHEAKRIAWDIVHRHSDKLTLRGKAVEAPFERCLRICTIDALRFMIPREEQWARGILDSDLINGVSDSIVIALTDDYDGTVNLGNQLQIVWTTDLTAAEPLLGQFDQLVDRLGLAPARYVVCVYYLRDTGMTGYVPRSFDAIDHPRFYLVQGCSESPGKTRPINSKPDLGLPELVHRRCSIVPDQWYLAQLQ